MLDLFDEFKGLVESLTRRRIDYAVCGGLAMAVHAFPRATIDIDLMIEPKDFQAVKALVGQLGYNVEAAPMSFRGGAVEIRRLSKVDAASGDTLMLDLLLVTPAVAQVWATRESLQWEHGTVCVVSKEGLIALKSLRGSGQDQEDIKHLKASDGDDEC